MENMRKFLELNLIQTNLYEKPISEQVQLHWRSMLDRIYSNINNNSLQKKKNTKSKGLDDTGISQQEQSFKCKCKKTKCLKLYCQCFASGSYCKNCNCQCCNNSPQYDSVRAEIIDDIMQKNPYAFDMQQKPKKTKCICKKTGCQKKYCECYNLGKKCGEECKCINCQNCM